MAIVSKFQIGDTGSSVDLNDTTGGFSLAGDGWLPVVATPVYKGDPDPVVETLHLLLTDTSQDNIAADIQALHEMQVKADRYINDPTVEEPIWLHAKMANETGERRAVVHKIDIQYGSSWYGDEATSLDIPVTINVTREPYWESTTARDLPQDTGASSTGVVYTYDYTAAGASVGAHDIVGDVGARVELMRLSEMSGTAHTFHWIGVRTVNKWGSDAVTNFEPVWEYEIGEEFTNVTTGADTGASGGGKIIANTSGWADGDFHQVSNIEMSSIYSTLSKRGRGLFLWLARARVTEGTWQLRLDWGPSSAISQIRQGKITEIDTTDWAMYETDIQKIPMVDSKIFSATAEAPQREGKFTVNTYAKRTSGTGDLELDCLVKIPIDEAYIKLESSWPTNNNVVIFGVSPIRNTTSFAGDTGGNNFGPETAVFNYNDNFSLPPGDGRIYHLWSASNSHLINDTLTLNESDIGKYYERWLSLRGSE